MIDAHHQQQGPSKHIELDKAFSRVAVSTVIPKSAISTPSFQSIHFMLFKFAQ
jgi:hypothetical protein